MTFSNEQEIAYEKFKQGKNIFITGPGGCGKTFFIQTIFKKEQENKTINVCALTGCAAVLLDCQATTIHSWSGIGIGKDDKEQILKRIAKKSDVRQRWKQVDVLIVDEVSMMSMTILELLDYIARNVRKSYRPFGGIQIIFSGDFYQLPPMNDDAFCFQSPLWNDLFSKECCIEFKQIFRQKDQDFRSVLNEIREGNLSANSEKILENFLNNTSLSNSELTKLFPLKYKVEKINEICYKDLKEEEVEYPLQVKTNEIRYIHSFQYIPLKKQKTPTKKQQEIEIDKLIKENGCSPMIRLKKGSLVMCLANLNVEAGICNGSQGIITGFNKQGPIVKFKNNGSVDIEMTVPLQQYQSKTFPSIVISQYPLCHAWAMTIHKIQGTTLDSAEIDIGNEIFTYGQSYVALSRLKSFDGLHLKAFSKKNIIAHPKVKEFYNSLAKK